MKIEVRMVIPEKTGSTFKYGYEHQLFEYFTKIVGILSSQSNLGKLWKKARFYRASTGYDSIKGMYLYYNAVIKSKKEDKIIWIDK